jgi:hypothetical protein
MIPINVYEEKVKHLAECFGCLVGSMPFTYLGLPMDTPPVTKALPLV